jgi:hypothetical protein
MTARHLSSGEGRTASRVGRGWKKTPSSSAIGKYLRGIDQSYDTRNALAAIDAKLLVIE